MNAPRSRRAVCMICSIRSACATICPVLEKELPQMSIGRMPTLSEMFARSHRNAGGKKT